MKTYSSVLTSLAVAGSLFVFAPGAHAETIISDSFTGTDGTIIVDHTPDVDLPGSAYTEDASDGFHDTLSGNTLEDQFDNSTSISVASHGTYVEPTGEVTLSADIEINNLTADSYDRGVFLGFSENGAAADPVFSGNLAGILVGVDGTVYLYEDGQIAQGLEELGAAPAGFSATTSYNLSYNLNLTTGILSDVVFDGKTYTVPAMTGNILGSGTVTDVAIGGSSSSALTNAFVDNLNLSSATVPEPSSWALLLTGGIVTACVLRRRMAKKI